MRFDGGQLSTDGLFQIMGNSRRRFIVQHLYRTDDAVDLKELAALIAAEEEGTALESVTNEERQRVYVSLYQTHLPTLTDSGLVSYDEDTRALSLNRGALEVHCLDPDYRSLLAGYVLGTLASVVVGLAVLFGLVSLTTQTTAGVFLLLALLLSVAGAVHLVVERRRQRCLLVLVD